MTGAGWYRFYSQDPFGNRLEFLEPSSGWRVAHRPVNCTRGEP